MDALDISSVIGFAPEVFRVDHIRGRVGQEIDARFAHALGTALGVYAAELGCRAIVVGKDARLSSVELAAALQAGIRAAGMGVIDIGMAPTALAYFFARLTDTDAAVMVTGGHDDETYNGFKIMFGGATLNGLALKTLHRRMQGRVLSTALPGMRSRINAVDCYVTRVMSEIRLSRVMKVAVDCGNGVTANLVPEVLRALGCEVTELSDEGRYTLEGPSHTRQARYLNDLAVRLSYTDCELAISLLGDGDRLVVMSRSGEVILPDRFLILFVRDVLSHRPGSKVIHDVKSSRRLTREIQTVGGIPIVCRSGEAAIGQRMRETGAVLAGETSGRFYFKDRWYGFNDATYAAARLLEILSRFENASEVLEALPQSCVTPELQLETAEGEQFRLVEALRTSGRFSGAREIIHLDGVRVEYEDGFGLAFPCLTQSAVMLRFEGDNGMALSRIQEDFRRQLLSVAPEIRLPF